MLRSGNRPWDLCFLNLLLYPLHHTQVFGLFVISCPLFFSSNVPSLLQFFYYSSMPFGSCFYTVGGTHYDTHPLQTRTSSGMCQSCWSSLVPIIRNTCKLDHKLYPVFVISRSSYSVGLFFFGNGVSLQVYVRVRFFSLLEDLNPLSGYG